MNRSKKSTVVRPNNGYVYEVEVDESLESPTPQPQQTYHEFAQQMKPRVVSSENRKRYLTGVKTQSQLGMTPKRYSNQQLQPQHRFAEQQKGIPMQQQRVHASFRPASSGMQKTNKSMMFAQPRDQFGYAPPSASRSNATFNDAKTRASRHEPPSVKKNYLYVDRDMESDVESTPRRRIMRQAEAPSGDEEILFTDSEIYEQGRYFMNEKRRGPVEIMADRQPNQRIMRPAQQFELEPESDASLYVVGQNQNIQQEMEGSPERYQVVHSQRQSLRSSGQKTRSVDRVLTQNNLAQKVVVYESPVKRSPERAVIYQQNSAVQSEHQFQYQNSMVQNSIMQQPSVIQSEQQYQFQNSQMVQQQQQFEYVTVDNRAYEEYGDQEGYEEYEVEEVMEMPQKRYTEREIIVVEPQPQKVFVPVIQREWVESNNVSELDITQNSMPVPMAMEYDEVEVREFQPQVETMQEQVDDLVNTQAVFFHIPEKYTAEDDHLTWTNGTECKGLVTQKYERTHTIDNDMPVSIELTTSQNGKIQQELLEQQEDQLSINMASDMFRMNEEPRIFNECLLFMDRTVGSQGKVAKEFEFAISYSAWNLDAMSSFKGIDTQKHTYEFRQILLNQTGQSYGIELSANESGGFETQAIGTYSSVYGRDNMVIEDNMWETSVERTTGRSGMCIEDRNAKGGHMMEWFYQDVVTGTEEYTNEAEMDEDYFMRMSAIYEILQDQVEADHEEWHYVRGPGTFELDEEPIYRSYEFSHYKLDSVCSGIDTQIRHYYDDSSAYFATGVCSGYEIETMEAFEEEHEEKTPWIAIFERTDVLVEDNGWTVQIFGAENMNGRITDIVYFGYDTHNAGGRTAFFARCNEIMIMTTFEFAMNIPEAVSEELTTTVMRTDNTHWADRTCCSEVIVLEAEEKIFCSEGPSTFWFDDSARVFEVRMNHIPRKAMNSQIASNYFVQADPEEQINGATGVAYGWMVKKYFVSASQEKDFEEEEEGADWTYAQDQNGVRASGDAAHASYHELAKRFHTESYMSKFDEQSTNKIEEYQPVDLDKYTRSTVKTAAKQEVDSEASIMTELKRIDQEQVVTDLNVNVSKVVPKEVPQVVESSLNMSKMSQSRNVVRKEQQALGGNSLPMQQQPPQYSQMDIESDYSKVYYSECDTEQFDQQTPRSKQLNTTTKSKKSVRKQQNYGKESHTGSYQYQQRLNTYPAEQSMYIEPQQVMQQPVYNMHDQQMMQQQIYLQQQQQQQILQQQAYMQQQNHNVSLTHNMSLQSNIHWLQEAGDLPSVEISRLSQIPKSAKKGDSVNESFRSGRESNYTQDDSMRQDSARGSHYNMQQNMVMEGHFRPSASNQDLHGQAQYVRSVKKSRKTANNVQYSQQSQQAFYEQQQNMNQSYHMQQQQYRQVNGSDQASYKMQAYQSIANQAPAQYFSNVNGQQDDVLSQDCDDGYNASPEQHYVQEFYVDEPQHVREYQEFHGDYMGQEQYQGEYDDEEQME